MDHQELLISPLQCQLCLEYTNGLVFRLELIEQTLQICFGCEAYVSNAIANIKENFRKLNAIYLNKIELVIDSNKIFYKLEKQVCRICYYKCICIKVCSGKHFFCFKCFQTYILNYFSKQNMRCPYDDCNQVIDDFFLLQFMSVSQFKLWVIEKYYFFCPNKNCKTILHFRPYQNVETKIIQTSINLSQCSSCKILICTKCWQGFTGSNIQHQSVCKQDKQITQLLQKPNIFQCPKCKMYSEQDCKMSEQTIQQCQVCRACFCLFCKTANLYLFNKEKPFEYSCNCKQNFINRKIIQLILFAALQVVYFLLIGLIALFGYELSIYIEFKVNSYNSRYIRYLYYIFFPIIIIFKTLGKFCKFVVENEHILLDFALKIFGIYEELWFLGVI